MKNKVLACNIRYVFDFTSTDALSIIGQLSTNAIPVDRFGYLNQYSPWLVQNTENELFKTNYTGTQDEFNTIIDNRVNYLINLANKNNYKIYISWSGGVDSSLVLTSFLRANINKDQLVVLYSHSSVEENPTLFNILNKEHISIIELTSLNLVHIYNECVKNGLLITGDHTECLSIPDESQLIRSIKNKLNYFDFYRKSYKDFLNIYIKDILQLNNTNAIDQLEEAFSYYKLPVKYTCELFWFINFFIEWNRYNLYSTKAILKQLHQNAIIFFDDVELQKWSMSKFDLIKDLNITDPKYYKKELKQLIYEYDKNEDYLLHKNKQRSLMILLNKEFRINPSLLSTSKYIVFDEITEKYNYSFNFPITEEYDYIQKYLNLFKKHED